MGDIIAMVENQSINLRMMKISTQFAILFMFFIAFAAHSVYNSIALLAVEIDPGQAP